MESSYKSTLGGKLDLKIARDTNENVYLLESNFDTVFKQLSTNLAKNKVTESQLKKKLPMFLESGG
jgi:hypothetical protein